LTRPNEKTLLMKKIVLFISAGRTDLKLLSAEHDRYCAIEIANHNVRSFHRWLLEHPERYVIEHQEDQSMPLYQKPLRNLSAAVEVGHGGDLKVFLEKQGIASSDELGVMIDHDERFIVVPVKLGRIIADLQHRQREGEYEIVAAIVFNTQRDDQCHFARDEPFACGPVLARWLAECFELEMSDTQQPKPGRSTWINLLQGNEAQELDDNTINPSAVNRLASALAYFADDPAIHAVLCGIGGIPRFKTLIRDTTFFYFDTRCLLAEDSENQQINERRVSVKPVGNLHITPEQSFALRASVAKLIAAGDFLGAEAAVRHVEDPQHLPWVLPIRTVADWFRGLKPDYSGIENQTLKDLLHRLVTSKVRCLLPALRTEAALQGRRYVEAINSTTVFADAAKWDGIERCLNDWGEVQRLDEFERCVEFIGKPKIPEFVLANANGNKAAQSALSKAKPKDISKFGYRPPKFGDLINPPPENSATNRQYKIDTMGTCEDIWLKAINLGSLTGINNSLNRPDKKNQRTPYHYRNINTHGVLSADELRQAVGAFVAAGLWKAQRDTDPINSLYFLSGSQVCDVLKSLGEARANDIYRNMVKGLLDNLKNFRWPQTG
jgi:hypothetical protein